MPRVSCIFSVLLWRLLTWNEHLVGFFLHHGGAYLHPPAGPIRMRYSNLTVRSTFRLSDVRDGLAVSGMIDRDGVGTERDRLRHDGSGIARSSSSYCGERAGGWRRAASGPCGELCRPDHC